MYLQAPRFTSFNQRHLGRPIKSEDRTRHETRRKKNHAILSQPRQYKEPVSETQNRVARATIPMECIQKESKGACRVGRGYGRKKRREKINVLDQISVRPSLRNTLNVLIYTTCNFLLEKKTSDGL